MKSLNKEDDVVDRAVEKAKPNRGKRRPIVQQDHEPGKYCVDVCLALCYMRGLRETMLSVDCDVQLARLVSMLP